MFHWIKVKEMSGRLFQIVMHDYKSLHATVVICAMLVNRQTDRHIQSL